MPTNPIVQNTMQQTIANVGTGAAVSTGVAGYLTQIAPLISVGIALVSAIVAAWFYWLNYKLRKREVDSKIRDRIRRGSSSDQE